MDPDTDDAQLVYDVTAEPKHGFLESKLKPGNPISTFTQGTEVVTLSGDLSERKPPCLQTSTRVL